MPKMIQVRHVSDDLHRTLKARAAMAGMSLSDYLLGELRHSAERPTRQELMERIAGRRPVRLRESAARAVRMGRDSR
jgi:plasmid stability protein